MTKKSEHHGGYDPHADYQKGGEKLPSTWNGTISCVQRNPTGKK